MHFAQHGICGSVDLAQFDGFRTAKSTSPKLPPTAALQYFATSGGNFAYTQTLCDISEHSFDFSFLG